MSDDYFVASIVEGHGEVQAVPVLLRRIFAEVHPGAYLPMNNPIRVKANRFLQDDAELFKYVTLAALQAKPHSKGIVLILLDCEDECPATVGPALLTKAQAVRSDVPISVALSHRGNTKLGSWPRRVPCKELKGCRQRWKFRLIPNVPATRKAG